MNFTIALDEEYISQNEFEKIYNLVARTRAAIRGFINYLVKYQNHKTSQNPEL